MDKNLYKKTLLQFAENDFEDLNIDKEFYLALALKYIGDTDPELRDDLNYPFLATLVGDEIINNDDTINLLKELLSTSYLFSNIEADESDDVFKRTFTALILAVIAAENIDRKFLSKDNLNLFVDSVIKYMQLETDFRGYQDDKGWAHSVAHIADVSNFLIKNEAIPFDKLMKLLHTLIEMYRRNNNAFTHNEDGRIAVAIETLCLRRDFDKDSFNEFIKSIDKSNYSGNYIADMYLKMNSKSLLRSIYFKLLSNKKTVYLCENILEQLELFGL